MDLDFWIPSPWPEHGNEQVEQQDIGDKKEDNQQQDDQPVGIVVGTWRPEAHDNLLWVTGAVNFRHASSCAPFNKRTGQLN